MRDMVDGNIMYTPDQLNTFFATSQTVRHSNTDFDFAYDSPTENFALINTFELEVYNVIHQIRSNAIGADCVPIRFLKIILSHILPYVTHVFNIFLMSPSYPASWKLSKIMPVAKTNDPGSLSDNRMENGNNHAEPDHCTHRKKWNDESTSIGLQIKPQPSSN
jgi:hypothetical protein